MKNSAESADSDPFLDCSSRTCQFQHTIYQQHEHILDQKLGLKIVSCKDFHLVAFHSIHCYHAPIFHFSPISFENFNMKLFLKSGNSNPKFLLATHERKIFEMNLGVILSIGTKNIHVCLIRSILVLLTVMIMSRKTSLLISSQIINWLQWNINGFEVTTSGRCGAESKKWCKDYCKSKYMFPRKSL